MKRLIWTAAAAIALVACSTTTTEGGYALKPEASNGHSLASLNLKPNAILESRQPAGSVMVQITDQFSDYGAGFVVAVTNLASSPQEFGPQSISATANGAPLAVYSPVELGDRIKGSARSKIRARDRGTQNFTGNPEDATESVGRERRFNMVGGCPAGEGRCLIESADQGSSFRQGERDRELNLQTAQEVAVQLQRDIGTLNNALGKGTIPPGEIGGGIIVVQHPHTGETVNLTVTFAGQPHTFQFKAAPRAS